MYEELWQKITELEARTEAAVGLAEESSARWAEHLLDRESELLTSLRHSVEELRNRTPDLSEPMSAIGALASRLDGVDSDLVQKGSSLADLSNSVGGIGQILDGVLSDQAALDSNVMSALSVSEDTARRLSETQAVCNGLACDLATAGETIASIGASLDDSVVVVESLSSQVSDFSAMGASLSVGLAEVQGVAEELGALLDRASSESEAAERKVACLEDVQRHLQVLSESLLGQVSSVIQDRSSLSEELLLTRRKLASATAALKGVTSSVSDIGADVLYLGGALDRSAESVNRVRDRHDGLVSILNGDVQLTAGGDRIQVSADDLNAAEADAIVLPLPVVRLATLAGQTLYDYNAAAVVVADTGSVADESVLAPTISADPMFVSGELSGCTATMHTDEGVEAQYIVGEELTVSFSVNAQDQLLQVPVAAFVFTIEVV